MEIKNQNEKRVYDYIVNDINAISFGPEGFLGLIFLSTSVVDA